MRIIAGTAKGLKIKSLKGIRPTLEIAKEALFNILGDRVKEVTVLDLYSGSGNIGIEALSRGAKCAVFVDAGFLQVKTIEENLKKCNLREKGRTLKSDAKAAIKTLSKEGMEFDLIFLAPPFLKDYVAPTLDAIKKCPILKSSGIIIVEHHKKEGLEEGFKLLDQRKFGDTIISFLGYENSDE